MNKDETKRINAYISASTPLSRRKADEAILNGRVSINGKTATLGDRVKVDDVVTLDGHTIEIFEKHTTYALNKPKGYVCSTYDPHIQHYARNLIKVEECERLHSIGRLDKDSEGLILFTTDGNLTFQITHPSSEIEKEYYVKTEEKVSDKDIKTLTKGIYDDGEFLKVKEATIMGPRELILVLTDGKNREIRRLIERIGNSVNRLVRLRIGGYSMPLSLKEGQFKKLSESDISKIFKDVKK